VITDVTFRPLREEETVQAARIHREAMGGFDWFDNALHTPAEDRAFYRGIVFAENVIDGAFGGEQLLGFLAWNKGWIEHLYVDPEFHSQGIGGALVERAKAGDDELRLWTFQANEGARCFYERHGFVAEEFTDGSGNEEKLPDVRYHWKRMN
jgi:putative acetyltransferase